MQWKMQCLCALQRYRLPVCAEGLGEPYIVLQVPDRIPDHTPLRAGDLAQDRRVLVHDGVQSPLMQFSCIAYIARRISDV